MAVDFFAGRRLNEEDEEQRNSGMVEQSTGQESPVIAGDPAAQQPGQPSRSGSFTNLQSYLDANESRKFGQEVAGRIGSEAQGAMNAQNEADKSFRSSVDKSAITPNEELLSRVKTDPTGVVKDQNAKSDFLRMRDAYYSGPKTLSDTEYYQPVAKQTEGAAKAAELSKDDAGRKSLLDQYYGAGADKPRYDYTSGQKKLDNYLIQVDPGSRQAFQGAQAATKQAQDKFAELSGVLDRYAGQRAGETAQTRALTRQTLGIDDAGNYVGSGELANTYNPVKSKVDELTAERDSRVNLVQDALRSRKVGNLSNTELGLLGFPPGTRLYNVDPTQYLTPNQNINVNTVATKEQQARMAALSELAGLDNTFLPYADLAGTQTNANPYSFNMDALTNAINQRQAQMNNEFRTTTTKMPHGGLANTSAPRMGSLEEALMAWDRHRELHPEDSSGALEVNRIKKMMDDIRRNYGYYDLA